MLCWLCVVGFGFGIRQVLVDFGFWSKFDGLGVSLSWLILVLDFVFVVTRGWNLVV